MKFRLPALTLLLAGLALLSACVAEESEPTTTPQNLDQLEGPSSSTPDESGVISTPAPLASLPVEGESFDEPELVGLSLTEVQAWAEESSLQLLVFDDIASVSVDGIFQADRLVVVVEDGVVTYSELG